MRFQFLTALVFSFCIFSCETASDKTTSTDTLAPIEEDNTEVKDLDVDTLNSMESNGLRLSMLTSLPKFPDAQLVQNKPEENAKLNKGENTFNFEVKNYQLGMQTQKEGCEHCSNSEKGQHIHFILNNAPYTALYKPEHMQELEDGTYIQLAFLSRSYHISIKTPDAYVLRKFTVGSPNEMEETDLNAPHMFYSRPKGDYSGEGSKKVVLDFFLVNSDLSESGNKVKATIDNSEFTIEQWAPYLIEGLEDGEHTVKLEFIDQDGKTIDSPFNPVTRTITVSSKESAS